MFKVTLSRRPIPRAVQDIGQWLVVTKIGVFVALFKYVANKHSSSKGGGGGAARVPGEELDEATVGEIEAAASAWARRCAAATARASGARASA